MIEVRPIGVEELGLVEDLGTVSYPPNYYEGSESFAPKILGNPSGCFVGVVDGELLGYVISFPYLLWEPYPLDEVYVPVGRADCLYVHDLCVSERARGLGLGSAMADVVLRGRRPVALTAVMGSEGFWERLGFGRVFELDYYGGRATYMILG